VVAAAAAATNARSVVCDASGCWPQQPEASSVIENYANFAAPRTKAPRGAELSLSGLVSLFAVPSCVSRRECA